MSYIQIAPSGLFSGLAIVLAFASGCSSVGSSCCTSSCTTSSCGSASCRTAACGQSRCHGACNAPCSISCNQSCTCGTSGSHVQSTPAGPIQHPAAIQDALVIPTPITDHDYGVPVIDGSTMIAPRPQFAPRHQFEPAHQIPPQAFEPAPAPEEIAPPTPRFHPVPTRNVFRPDPREPSPYSADKPIYFSPPTEAPVVPLDSGR